MCLLQVNHVLVSWAWTFLNIISKLQLLRLDYFQEVEKIVAITYSDFHNWNCHSLMLLILNVAQILNGFVFICILLKTLVINMCMILSYFLLMSSPIQQAQLNEYHKFWYTLKVHSLL